MAGAWTIEARYETKEQAKAAAVMVVSTQPKSWKFAYVEGDREVWTEHGRDYHAVQERI